MKALMRSLLITGVVVLALAAVFILLLMQPQAQQTEDIVFTDVEPVEIASVQVQNATGTYRYFYEGDGYVLDDIPGTIADIDAFIRFMTECGKLSAIRRVNDGALDQFGLDEPMAMVNFQFFDADPKQMTLGQQEKISGNYYVAMEGFPGVYLMDKAMAEPFLRPKTQVISRLVTPALAVSSPLSAIRDITFTGGMLKELVSIQATSGGTEQVRLAGLSFGTATHIVRGAGVFQLDQAYGVELLGSLFGIEAQEIVGYNLPAAEVSKMGFDAPWMSVEYDLMASAGANLQHCVLEVVDAGDGTFLVTMKGSGIVYRIGPQPFMGIEYEKLQLRWFLTPMLMDISAVTVEGDGQQYRFSLDNADLKNPVVSYEQATLDTKLFRSFFRLITSAAHDGAYLGKLEKPQGEPALTITYEYKDPAKTPDVMALYPGKVRRADVFVNGVGEFAMKDQFISRVLEGCENLVSGQSIEENW